MAKPEDRAACAALSNTAIGLLLIAGGAFGFLAGGLGPEVAIAAFAAMALAAALVGLGLDEVQK